MIRDDHAPKGIQGSENVLSPLQDPAGAYAYRLVHVDALPALLARQEIHAPEHIPTDGRTYPPIHDAAVQPKRAQRQVASGPGGTIGDYVSFYFGRHSPMLLRLATGRVDGYTAGQDPLIHLVTTVDDVRKAGRPFVFTDGHSLAKFTRFYEGIEDLARLDWPLIRQRYWADNEEDNDRERRKQAELLVWHSLPWSAIRGLAVRTLETATRAVEHIENAQVATPVRVLPNWYYQGKP